MTTATARKVSLAPRERSDTPEIEELAQNIVSAQQEEIEQMEAWREQWYRGG